MVLIKKDMRTTGGTSIPLVTSAVSASSFKDGSIVFDTDANTVKIAVGGVWKTPVHNSVRETTVTDFRDETAAPSADEVFLVNRSTAQVWVKMPGTPATWGNGFGGMMDITCKAKSDIQLSSDIGTNESLHGIYAMNVIEKSSPVFVGLGGAVVLSKLKVPITGLWMVSTGLSFPFGAATSYPVMYYVAANSPTTNRAIWTAAGGCYRNDFTAGYPQDIGCSIGIKTFNEGDLLGLFYFTPANNTPFFDPVAYPGFASGFIEITYLGRK